MYDVFCETLYIFSSLVSKKNTLLLFLWFLIQNTIFPSLFFHSVLSFSFYIFFSILCYCLYCFSKFHLLNWIECRIILYEYKNSLDAYCFLYSIVVAARIIVVALIPSIYNKIKIISYCSMLQSHFYFIFFCFRFVKIDFQLRLIFVKIIMTNNLLLFIKL